MPDSILNKEKLRKSVGLTIEDFDEELKDLERTAIQKMKLSGIIASKIKAEDSFVTTTILAYVKANFRFTDQDVAIRYKEVFEENKNYMRSTKEYTEEESSGING